MVDSDSVPTTQSLGCWRREGDLRMHFEKMRRVMDGLKPILEMYPCNLAHIVRGEYKTAHLTEPLLK
jgi:hypothetical protein